MDITLPHTAFSEAVQRVAKITARQAQLPVLTCILFIAEGNTVKLRATNLDIGIELELPARVAEPGVAAIPGDLLGSLVGQLSPAEKVRLRADNGACTVEAGRSVNRINVLPYEDFPILPSVAPDERLELKGTDIAGGLRSVWYSAASSSMKPELASVFVSLEDRGVVFAATDSFRLAEKVLPAKIKSGFSRILIPVKNVPDIIRNIESHNEPVSIAASDAQLAIVTPGMYLTSRVIDGMFPDYRQIIPKSFTTTATVLKQDVMHALKIANVFANTFNQVTLSVDPKHKQCAISTKNQHVGESSVSLDAAVTGEPVTMSFNHRYITDCFQAITADSISFLLNGAGKPMVVGGAGDKTFTYLVMPMNR